jgi:hypothetical protein
MNNSLPPLPLIDGCLFVDNSSWIEGMSTCYRYLQYKSLNLRVSAAEKPSLNFGSAIHLGLEYRYVKYGNKPIDDDYYNDVGEMLTEFFEKHPTPDGDWRTLNWCMTVLRKYNEEHAIEEFSLLKNVESVKCPYCEGKGFEYTPSIDVPNLQNECKWCSGAGTRDLFVELPFALPLYTSSTGVPVIYTGRIDLPISLNGSTYVMDHKTTGMLGSMFWDGMRMTSQQRGYVWAFQELTGVPVSGYIINALRTKEPPIYVQNNQPSPRGKSTSPETWWKESLARERFLIKQHEIEEWKRNTIDLVEEFFWHYSRGYMPMKTSWCSSYGRCSYYDVCQLHSEDKVLLLNSGQFAENTWSPLNKFTPTQAKQ